MLIKERTRVPLASEVLRDGELVIGTLWLEQEVECKVVEAGDIECGTPRAGVESECVSACEFFLSGVE
jgi:hypothetical protein